MLMELATLLQGHLSREKPLTRGGPIVMPRLSTTVIGSGTMRPPIRTVPWEFSSES